MEERALSDARRLCDLAGRGSGVALFQEQRHRCPQYLLLRHQTV